MKKDFSIVIPVYNEQDNIISLLDEIQNHLINFKNFEIIIVNDFSNDNTLHLIKKIQLTIDNLVIISNSKNLGQSYSLKRGILQSNSDIIITIDGDGQNDPSDIKKLLNLYNANKDIKLVGGIRQKRKDSILKIISSKVANYIRSKILNDNCSDTGCSLKVFDKNIFLQFEYFNGIHRFLPALFKGYNYDTFFLNVSHRKRKYGKSNYGTIERALKGIIDIIRVLNIIRNKKKND